MWSPQGPQRNASPSVSMPPPIFFKPLSIHAPPYFSWAPSMSMRRIIFFKPLTVHVPPYLRPLDVHASPYFSSSPRCRCVTTFVSRPNMSTCHPISSLAPKGPSVTLFLRGPLNVHMSPYLPTPCYWWLRPTACQAIVAAQSLPTRALWHAFWHAFVARGLPSSSPAEPEWLSPMTAAFFRVMQKSPFGGPGCFGRPRVLQNGGTLCLRCALKRRL